MSNSISLPGPRARRIAVTLMGLSLALASSGVADASYTYSNTTRIYACVNRTTQVVRIVIPRNGHTACRSTERLVSWSKVGSIGAAGPAGAAGAVGATGPAGPAGADGATGPAGPAGADGAVGPAGADGTQGPAGPAGADGATGADGAQGPAGADGAVGPVGADGAQGPAGPAGPAGADGAAGPTGADGAQGPAGPAGPAGPVGPTGADGPALGGNAIVTGLVVSNTGTASSATASASCPSGTVMLSGGGRLATNDTITLVQLTASYPSASDTWTVSGAANVKNTKTWSIQAFAVCSA